MDKTIQPAMPRTLAEAHQTVADIRPAQKAPPTEWLAYHQRSAAVYAEVAEIDRGHHHETLFMAERERQLAKEIKTQIPRNTRVTRRDDRGEGREARSAANVDAGS